MGYRLVRRLVRLLVGLFYREVEVVGLGHLPATGPLVVAANHQNALVDPMLLLATLPRRLLPLAKAPLFRHPIVAPFLYLMGAVPVHRRQEGGTDPARNEAMFRTATAALHAGRAVLIFPEGLSHEQPVLLPLRTGAARLLLAAEAGPDGRLGVTLTPVGLVFHEPGAFRAGRAVVLVGPPVETADCVARYGQEPEAAVRALTARLAAALRRLIVEADDWQTLHLVRLAETIWREDAAAGPRDEAAGVAWGQQGMRVYRYLCETAPERVVALRRRLEAYGQELARAGAAGPPPGRGYPPSVVLGYAVREGLPLLLGLPLALVGLVVHALPYRLTGLGVRAMRPTLDVEATDKIALGLVLYPLCWLAEGWLAWRLGGAAALAAFAALLLPAGFFAVAWRERLADVGREARALVRFLRDRDVHRRLRERRRALADELAALAGLVPESVRVGPDAGR